MSFLLSTHLWIAFAINMAIKMIGKKVDDLSISSNKSGNYWGQLLLKQLVIPRRNKNQMDPTNGALRLTPCYWCKLSLLCLYFGFFLFSWVDLWSNTLVALSIK